MKFRLSMTVLEDRSNPTDVLGTAIEPPPIPYDPGAPPAQVPPVDPVPVDPTGGPTPIIPPTPGYPGGIDIIYINP